jgi:hypothetical protein
VSPHTPRQVFYFRLGRTRRIAAVTLAAAIVIAGCLGAWLYVSVVRAPSAPKADGPTFYQALAGLNESITNLSGGPWTLYAVWGIASPIPFSPDALGWASNNVTVNSCGAQFNGLTLWNGSIPLFSGSFDSGTAPFWQFAFFSNSSQSILIATDVLGVTHVYPPMLMSSPCARASSLDASPWIWARNFSPFPSNSVTMAKSSWNAVGERWTTANRPAYETYVLGWSYWGSGNPEGLIVKFARCGQVGATGVQPFVDVLLNSNGSWSSYFNGTQGCGDVVTLGPPPTFTYYSIDFSTTDVSQGTSLVVASQSFQVTYGNRSADSDARGLVSWMTSLNFTTSTGQQLPSVVPGCAGWVPSLTDCHENGPGWYAVLLSASGEWLDSYPSSPNGTAWEVSSVSLASNQVLVIIAPASWNVAGDGLTFNGTTLLGGVPVVSGSTNV